MQKTYAAPGPRGAGILAIVRYGSNRGRKGSDWQLVDGQIMTRGTEAFKAVVKDANAALEDSGRPTVAVHIHEALQGLSQRPKADLPGAIYHAVGALEAVARGL